MDSRGYPAAQRGLARVIHADCLDWLKQAKATSIQAVVTDPPYGLTEYSPHEQDKLRNGNNGGVWRLPPSFDGYERIPLPRFTTLSALQRDNISLFFREWAAALLPALVPGAHVFVASNPLVSFLVAASLASCGFESRGEIVRLVTTMRGGDRPKGAHDKFPDTSVIPRSMWEPWLLFRKPIEGRVQDNLLKWRTGALRRPPDSRPFADVIASCVPRKDERAAAAHPSLKPQSFLRQIVRASLPLGEGVVLDCFAGSGSTLAAAWAVGYHSIGVEADVHYYEMAKTAIPRLAKIEVPPSDYALYSKNGASRAAKT